MKVLKDLYGFVFGKSKPNKRRKLTPPSERPKNAYLKYVEHGLINEGVLIGQYTGEWVKDQKVWRKYFKANKDFVMINIHNADPLRKLLGLERFYETANKQMIN